MWLGPEVQIMLRPPLKKIKGQERQLRAGSGRSLRLARTSAMRRNRPSFRQHDSATLRKRGLWCSQHYETNLCNVEPCVGSEARLLSIGSSRGSSSINSFLASHRQAESYLTAVWRNGHIQFSDHSFRGRKTKSQVDRIRSAVRFKYHAGMGTALAKAMSEVESPNRSVTCPSI